MQDKYVADVGDFGKFQLFRYLFNHKQSPLNGKELSQIWFMHQGEGEETNDGKHIDYFERMMGTDEYLEHSLLDVIMRDKREVTELENLKLLPSSIKLSKRMQAVVHQNFAWAVVYNVVAIPIAAMGLVAPWMAAIGMSMSSLLVVLNALRLKN